MIKRNARFTHSESGHCPAHSGQEINDYHRPLSELPIYVYLIPVETSLTMEVGWDVYTPGDGYLSSERQTSHLGIYTWLLMDGHLPHDRH